MFDTKTFDHQSLVFDEFVANRKKINSSLRAISGIITPCEEFVEENHYIEVTEFVDNVITGDELDGVLSSLSIDNKKLLLLTIAGTLSNLHSHGIFHLNLNLQNILLFKSGSGHIAAKLIGFENSCYMDDKPTEDVIGDVNFYSPELGTYLDAEDEKEELSKTLTEKSDIFSLGLIFHFYLSGEYPQAKTLSEQLQKRKEKGKAIYCWTVLNNDCELAMSDKITNLNYLSLIQDMLNKDPEKRPTATQVLQRLRTINEEEKSLKPSQYIIDSGADKERLYDFAEPWAEHNIEFDIVRMRSRGFVASKQRESDGIKGYDLIKSDSSLFFYNVEKVLAMKYATKKVAPPPVITEGVCDPWSEHNVTFDADQIKRKGYSRIERKTMGGVNGYSCIKADGTSQFIRIEMLVIQKMATKN